MIFAYHSGSASQARMRAEEYAIANYLDFTVGPKAVPAREQRRCDTTGGKLFLALGSWSLPAKRAYSSCGPQASGSGTGKPCSRLIGDVREASGSGRGPVGRRWEGGAEARWQKGSRAFDAGA